MLFARKIQPLSDNWRTYFLETATHMVPPTGGPHPQPSLCTTRPNWVCFGYSWDCEVISEKRGLVKRLDPDAANKSDLFYLGLPSSRLRASFRQFRRSLSHIFSKIVCRFAFFLLGRCEKTHSKTPFFFVPHFLNLKDLRADSIQIGGSI